MNRLHKATNQVVNVLSSVERYVSKRLDIPFKEPELKESWWRDSSYQGDQKKIDFWYKALGADKEVKPFDARLNGFIAYVIIEKVVLAVVALAVYCLWR